jgi:zinc transporter ZupT
MNGGQGEGGSFAVVMLAASVACGITSAGILLVGRYEEWARDHAVYFMSFAAGVLLTVSLVHITPRSSQMSDTAPLFLLAGFLGLFLSNRFLSLFLTDDEQPMRRAWGLVPILGIGFHSFVDGVIYSITFKTSLFTGALTAIGMILHEFPEGIIAFVLLKRGGYGRKRAMLYAFLAAALSTPLGALVSYPLMQQITVRALGSLLAVSAGALIYVGATHLLPAVEKESKPYTLLTMLAGVAAGLIIIMSKGNPS